jgi:hypothetical protein
VTILERKLIDAALLGQGLAECGQYDDRDLLDAIQGRIVLRAGTLPIDEEKYTVANVRSLLRALTDRQASACPFVPGSLFHDVWRVVLTYLGYDVAKWPGEGFEPPRPIHEFSTSAIETASRVIDLIIDLLIGCDVPENELVRAAEGILLRTRGLAGLSYSYPRSGGRGAGKAWVIDEYIARARRLLALARSLDEGIEEDAGPAEPALDIMMIREPKKEKEGDLA